MCIGIWTLEHPEYALVLCTNRDEFLDRPTQNAHFHSFQAQDIDSPTSDGQILSGRDVQAGGSWFGINRAGRVALLTNITEPARKYHTSRGSLVSSFLLSQSSHPLEDEVGKIIPEDANYAGFNLLLFAPSLDSDTSDASPIHYDALLVTNHGGGGTLASRPLQPNERNCAGMSNGIDGAGADLWPKVQHAAQDFGAAVKALPAGATETELTVHLFNLLAWHPPQVIAHRSELRNTVQVLPVPIILDGPASTHPTPSFYGTRLSTVLLVRKDGEALFIERDIWQLKKDEEGNERPIKSDPPTERRFRFKLELNGSANMNTTEGSE